MSERADSPDKTPQVPSLDLRVRIRFRTPEGDQRESILSSAGENGLFIEQREPLPVGTELRLAFALPGGSSEWVEAKGLVVWVCPKPDQYTFSCGMGVRVTEVLGCDASGEAAEVESWSDPVTFSRTLMAYTRSLQHGYPPGSP